MNLPKVPGFRRYRLEHICDKVSAFVRFTVIFRSRAFSQLPAGYPRRFLVIVVVDDDDDDGHVTDDDGRRR